jgi:hypothetical protein
MNIVILFIIINFIVSAISDIVIRYFAFQSNANARLKSLRHYYKVYGKITAAVLAGITVCSLLLIHLLLFKVLFGIYLPTRSNKYIIYFIILAFILGYVTDYVIHINHVFGHALDEYYKIKYAYVWGMMAYVFSIIISYNILFLFGILKFGIK